MQSVGASTRNANVHPCGKRPRPTGRDTELNIIELDPLGNKLLARLPRADFDLLVPYLVCGPFAQGTVLAEAGDEVEQIYFPLSGMISLVVVMKDGKAIETATIGRDGVFGASSGFDLHKSRVRAIVQVQMKAARMSASQFRKAVAASKTLQKLCIDDGEALLAQARVTAACNALHKVEARFCRWLLQTSETTESETITLTQEFLSEMLGVRRTSVTEVASKLQADGVISYSRGHIKIIDRPALEQMSCECFQTLREQKAL
jgi:CRP-like cAMP-binding protein